MNKIQEFFDERAKDWDKHETKDEAYFDSLLAKLSLKKGMKVLDLACGTGVITNSIFKITGAYVLGLDLSPKMIEVANKKYNNPLIEFKAEDFYDANLSGFDAIVCHNAYPHFLERDKFKQSVLKALNKNGLLIICHSNSKDEINNHHKGKEEISLPLDTPLNEANIYLDSFRINKQVDSSFYVLELVKII